ncbi:MAG: hypothetical protein FD159_2740, partial [Syntrophaceae bacterium]
MSLFTLFLQGRVAVLHVIRGHCFYVLNKRENEINNRKNGRCFYEKKDCLRFMFSIHGLNAGTA